VEICTVKPNKPRRRPGGDYRGRLENVSHSLDAPHKGGWRILLIAPTITLTMVMIRLMLRMTMLMMLTIIISIVRTMCSTIQCIVY